MPGAVAARVQLAALKLPLPGGGAISTLKLTLPATRALKAIHRPSTRMR